MTKFNKLLLSLLVSSAFFSTSAMAGNSLALISQTPTSENGLPSLAPLLEHTVPAVVNISVKGKKDFSNEIDMFDIPDQFRFFFPNTPREQQREFSALGSGVIIDAKNGYVITNYHVVENANEITITLHDGRTFEAIKKGEDQQTDCALLQLKDFSNLTEVKFANSDKIKVGDFAIAIGNPFGLGQTVTSGIISALGRSGLNIENYENFIQTDAAINSGNSGGALINLRGELIGINTAILGKSGGNIGIGFAIPSNMIKSVVDQLLTTGTVKRGMLGIMGTEITPELAKNFDYPSTNGAFVNEVMKDSAADKAGIQSGDILTSINGVQIKNFGQLRAKIATLGAGSKIELGIFRNGNNKNVTVTLDANKEQKISANSKNPLFEGITLANTEGNKGVEITDIKKNQRMNLPLAKGDIIIEVNRIKISNIDDFNKAMEKQNKFLALKVIRGNSTIYITQNY